MSEKLTRRDTREAVFLLLFQNELTGEPVEEAADACKEAYEMAVNGEILKTAAAVTEKYGEFDEIIGKYSQKREVSRISAINKTILRLALYEMLYCPAVPARVAVNEAVELSKKYAEKQDSSFINGVLGNYMKDSGNNDD